MEKQEKRMLQEDCPCGETTEAIIAGAFEVSNSLGCGFLEKVYEKALVVELRRRGLHVATQVPVRILYRQETVGDYRADIIVDRSVLVEVKATVQHHDISVAQTLNYLRATKLPVALLINFGRPKVKYKRLVFLADAPDLAIET